MSWVDERKIRKCRNQMLPDLYQISIKNTIWPPTNLSSLFHKIETCTISSGIIHKTHAHPRQFTIQPLPFYHHDHSSSCARACKIIIKRKYVVPREKLYFIHPTNSANYIMYSNSRRFPFWLHCPERRERICPQRLLVCQCQHILFWSTFLYYVVVEKVLPCRLYPWHVRVELYVYICFRISLRVSSEGHPDVSWTNPEGKESTAIRKCCRRAEKLLSRFVWYSDFINRIKSHFMIWIEMLA